MLTKRATLVNLPDIAYLFDLYRVWYGQVSDLDGALSFLEERFIKKESVIFFVTDDNGKALGFTQLYPYFSSTRMKRLCLLNDLFVLEEARGKGISKLLINAAKKHCKETGACGVTLETQKSNAIGNKLYPATGFKLNTTQHFYEWNP
ncbi:MAG: GNAT family N-acetyltransferase [Saprospiraceae bacterium]